MTVALDRANINGDVQTDVADTFKGFANEYYVNICTERNWTWRKFDRSLVFKKAIDIATFGFENDRRVSLYDGAGNALTNLSQYRGRTISTKVDGVMYRIVGSGTTSVGDPLFAGKAVVILDAPLVEAPSNLTAADARMYEYEFALPPDCDTISDVFCEGQIDKDGQIDVCNNSEFNRCMSQPAGLLAGPVRLYTRDGKILATPSLNVQQPLDQVLLGYDFLGGDEISKSERIRFFPPEPDRNKVIHFSYSTHITEMSKDEDEPIIPKDDRWILIHYMLYEWWKKKGNKDSADRELRDAEKILRAMREEQRKTDTKPKMIVDGRRFQRQKTIERDDTRFRIARIAEGSS